MSVTIWHNPGCGTSRNALQRIRARGIEPTIYLYLKTPPDRAALQTTLRQLGIPASELLRQKDARTLAPHLLDSTDEEAILHAMVQTPKLIERPIVLGPGGAVIARPIDRLDSVLP